MWSIIELEMVNSTHWSIVGSLRYDNVLSAGTMAGTLTVFFFYNYQYCLLLSSLNCMHRLAFVVYAIELGVAAELCTASTSSYSYSERRGAMVEVLIP